jgi:hypothetical protein
MQCFYDSLKIPNLNILSIKEREEMEATGTETYPQNNSRKVSKSARYPCRYSKYVGHQ